MKEAYNFVWINKKKNFINGFARGKWNQPSSLYLSQHNSMGTATDVTCENDNISDLSFDKFNKLYFEKFNTTLDSNWLGWFVGFAEGDGYLGINGNIPVFVLTQKESKILYKIINKHK